MTNNDVGVWLFNGSDCSTVCLASTTATKNAVKFNTISNAAVTNTTGFSATCGYQAGVADLGKNDGIVNNSISGFATRRSRVATAPGRHRRSCASSMCQPRGHGVPSNK